MPDGRPNRCDLCGGRLNRGLAAWHAICGTCGAEAASLATTINQTSARVAPDEQARARGLAPVRDQGYRRVLRYLDAVRGKTGGSLLEVGSAHAWFLCAASSHFDRLVGIEPDDAVRQVPDDARIEIRAGYFPQEVHAGEKFDVVVFNDVFEHIPDARQTAAAVVTALNDGGIAVINLPVREGAIYRASRLLYRTGVRGPFERMWQKDFPSPHLYYFSQKALIRLFEDLGCTVEEVISMPTLRVSGLWSRIRYGEPRLLTALCAYACSLAMAPLITSLPADVKCFFFSKIGQISSSGT